MNRLFASLTLIVLSALSAFGHETGFPHSHLFSDPDNPAGFTTLAIGLSVAAGIGFGIFLYDYRRKNRRNSRDAKKDRSEAD